MRKGRDGGNGGKKRGKNKKRRMKIVATTSLPAVNRPNGYAQTTTAGTPHARANYQSSSTVQGSAQPELVVYYLVAGLLILAQLPYADTAYYTQFSCKAELLLKNKLPRVGGLVGGAAGGMKNFNWV